MRSRARLTLALAAALFWAGQSIAAAGRGGETPSAAFGGETPSAAFGGATPVEIHGKRVEYRGKEGRAVFSGGVIVTRGDSTLKCDTLETLHGSAEAIARGNVAFSDRGRMLDLTCVEAQYTHGMRHVTAAGDCRLIAGEGTSVSVVLADSMELLVEERKASARGRVRIVQGDAEAKCEEAHLYGGEDRLVLLGRPVLLRPPHRFECDEAESFFKEGRTILKGEVTGNLHAKRLDELK